LGIRLTPLTNAQTVLDIRSFGARCNGSDDTGAVQAALNAIPVGGTLNFSCMAGISQVSLSNRANITIAGTNGGGVTLLSDTGDNWSRAFVITYCSSCTIRDMVFEGNNKNIIAFNIEESSNSTVSGLTIRNLNQPGAAMLAQHNNYNKYLNNTVYNVGISASPATNDVARGMWFGGVSLETNEFNPTISGNNLSDIAGTAIAVHGSGITITNNVGTKLNWACVKVLPLGSTSNSTLVAGNNCSGAGARWVIGGGIMTEYYNSSTEATVIRDNVLEGYSASDVTRVPDSPSVGINVANSPDKMTHNVQILNNTVRNMLYDSIQISGPTDNYRIEGNILERTISNGTQWNGISIQGDQGKVITNGVIRRNIVRGKFDGIRMNGSSSGLINGLTIDSNSVTSVLRDGLHIEVDTGTVAGVSSTNNCYASIGNKTVWDNRSNPIPVAPMSPSCSDPTSSVSVTAPAAGQTVSGTVTLQSSTSATMAGVQFKVDGAAYGAELVSLPYSLNWDSKTVSNGPHSITADARDSAGNHTTSAVVSVTVSNTIPDTTAPTVSIGSPSAGQTVSGTVSIAASASDNVGVAGVQFLIDGAASGSELTTAPYSLSWNTTTASNGSHSISAVARDAAGNRSTSTAVSVTVSNATPDTTAPTVSITSPTAGQTVSGSATLTASATDNVKVVGVQFLVDGAAYGSEVTAAPYSLAWTTTSVSNGSHSISATARDAAGNRKTSSTVSVTVSNTTPDTTAPTVSITAPGPGQTIAGTVTLMASATDNVKVVGVQFLVDGAAYGSELTAAPYSLNWTTTSVANGSHSISATARDAAGNRKTSNAVSVTISNVTPDTTAPTVSITAPAAGQTVSGSATLTASATDNVKVVGVQFLVDGVSYGSELTAAPYSLAWTTTSVANGSHSISATARDAAGNRKTSSAVAVTVSNANLSSTGTTIRVNAGGPAYTDPSGNVWAADNGFSGGQIDVVSASIASTTTPALYQTSRWNNGTLSYQFNVVNGTYTVNLKFAETYFKSAGQRVFGVTINGAAALTNFDIVAAAGGANRAIDKATTVTVTGGVISIQIKSTVDDPQVNAIEILPQATTPPVVTPPVVTPPVVDPPVSSAVAIRVNAGGAAYTDPSGNVWAADTGYSGGQPDVVTTAIANTTTAALYQTSRWDNKTLTYRFTVPNGGYSVNLKFAETYFKNAGQRIFGVSINGVAVLTNFDIVAAAGGSNRAIDKAFQVTVTGGAIAIQLTATVDDPQVNAIEILAQTTSTSNGSTSGSTTPPPATPVIRVNAGGPAYTDPTGTSWAADTGFSGGYLDVVSAAIANTTTPALYQTSRWNGGSLAYQFTVPNATYTVNLKFAETYFTRSGQRVFNVAINGQPVLANFDIVAQAGAANRAVDKAITVPVTNGAITIQLTGVVDDPQINAIEIY
jgi:glutamine amidotransferase PdxT